MKNKPKNGLGRDPQDVKKSINTIQEYSLLIKPKYLIRSKYLIKPKYLINPKYLVKPK